MMGSKGNSADTTWCKFNISLSVTNAVYYKLQWRVRRWPYGAERLISYSGRGLDQPLVSHLLNPIFCWSNNPLQTKTWRVLSTADLLNFNSRCVVWGNKTLLSLKYICHTFKLFASIFTCYFWLNIGHFHLHCCEMERNKQWVYMWPRHLCCILCWQTGSKTGLNRKCIYFSFVMWQVR